MFSASLCTKMWGNSTIIPLQNAEHNISYSYDSGSVRVSKNVDGAESKYAYINGLLVYEIRGGMRFYYCYDASGMLYSVNFTRYDGAGISTYYFSHNSRGDIIGIYDGSGTLQAKYEYDAWGNVLSITDANGNAITSATHIGNLNPFRYRGYYYDSESGLYYLMSRYYDPATHRFVNSDDEDVLQESPDLYNKNLFAYADNNPILRTDDEGEWWHIAIASVIGGIVGGVVELGSQIASGEGINWGKIGIEALTGAATGALGACGVPPVAYCAISGGIGALNSGLRSWNNGNDGWTIAKDALKGGIESAALATAGRSLKAVGRKVTSAQHMKWGKVGTWIKKTSNTQSSKSSIAKIVTKMIKSSQKVTAPTKTTQKYCRGCGRPIGKQYAWQCSSPSYY